MLATSVADKLDEMDAVVAGSSSADAVQAGAVVGADEASEGLDFSADEETGYATIDLGGEEELEVAAAEELSELTDVDDGVDAELDLEVDEDDDGDAEGNEEV
jgi:hypothetical protein